MTGRARGRSRGRGKSNQEAPQPGGAQAQPQPAAAPVVSRGRGRSRGNVAAANVKQVHAPTSASGSAAGAGAAAAGAAAAAAPIVKQVAQMSVRDEREPQGERRRRRGFSDQPATLQLRKEGQVVIGTHGAQVNIVSNFFKLDFSSTDLNMYSVVFEPEVHSISFKKAMLHQLNDVIGTTRCFDGMVLYLPMKLPDPVTQRTATSNNNEDFAVTITHTCRVPANSPSIVNLLNVLFKKQLGDMQMQRIGRNYYNPARKIEVSVEVQRGHPTVLQVWPGLSTSILQYEESIMLCTDVSHKVMRKESVLDYLYALNDALILRGQGGQFFDQASKFLIGETVLTRYNNKTYRIDDIDWGKCPTDKFQKSNGTEQTFMDYYQQTYNRLITDKKQPMLISKPRDKDKKRGAQGPILLLPEFCSVAGLSDEMRSNFNVMKDLSEHTRISPAGRAQSLQGFMNELQGNEKAQRELTNWNMNFERNLVQMTGRCYPAEQMCQRNDKFSYKVHEADWSREMRGRPLISTVNLKDWLLVYVNRDMNCAQDFVGAIKKVCGPMGISVNDPVLCNLNDDSARSYFSALKSHVSGTTQIAVCIVPNNRKDRYDAIKKLCCVEVPVPSQVVVSRTLSKKQMLLSVCTKIGIQLNCKMGGTVWAVTIPLKNIMVVGYDVYHDSLTQGKSIGGFVASTNDSLTNYYSRITIHSSHQEICDQLKVCMTGALRKYKTINGCLPDRVFVYRDGVGDGQINMVHDHELPQFKEAFKSVGCDPMFAMIVVKKRISTRLFLNQNNQLSNPPPGTVVDSVVTRREWFDFFLISQSVRQGTVSPTHYNVIYDNSGLKADHFQRLTYKLCHLYYNWPGTIRVPAPCQYAHKLAFLVGQSIHQEPNPVLADRLYYL